MRTALWLWLAVSVVISSESVQAQSRNSVQLGVTYNGLSNPIWRSPSGHEEVNLGQSASVVGVRGGWLFLGERGGFGAELSGTHATFTDFRVPRSVDFPGSPVPDTARATYSSPSFTLGTFDLSAYWRPWRNGPVSTYGVLGMGLRKQSYRVSGAQFADWNGQKNNSEFIYSYGLGLRLGISHLALVGDYRLFPGDASTQCPTFLYSRGGYDYYLCEGHSSTANYTKLASIGLLLFM